MRSRFPLLTLIYLGISILAVFLSTVPGSAEFFSQENPDYDWDISNNISLINQNYYFPIIYRKLIDTANTTRRINAPYFDVESVTAEKFSEMAIAWFGKVTPSINYTDIRVGFNDEALYVHLEVFDRLLWYDNTPVYSDFKNWDSATLYLSLDGNTGTTPDLHAYRFDAQLNWWEEREPYQAAYRGNGSGWQLISVHFNTISGWRGNAPNDNIEDRGWVVTFKVPFTEVLGLSGRPASGTIWGMGVILHDRDDATGTPIELQGWPEGILQNAPVTWGHLRFGLPIYSPPLIEPTGSITIRHKLDGEVVPDAAVGGTIYNMCPGDPYFIWNVWGNMNFAGATDFNIQNQGDVADWPCFAKYYVSFPMDKIPEGKEIISGKLTLYHWGNSGDLTSLDPSWWPKPSLVQALSVLDEWDEQTLTWNNGPLAWENIAQTWVYPLEEHPGHPGIRYEWDVSYAVKNAYLKGVPLRLSLYEADSAYHSGKYFVSSDTGDWNEIGRPTLVVIWGDPELP